MVSVGISLLLAMRVVAHWGAVHHVDQPLFYPIVEVRDCKDQMLSIYADKDLTTPLPNPVTADQNGVYVYFADTPYVKEKILFGEETIVNNNCLIRSPENGQTK